MGDRLGILRADGTLFFFCHPFFQWVGSVVFPGLETEPNPFGKLVKTDSAICNGLVATPLDWPPFCTLMAIGKKDVLSCFLFSGELVGTLGNHE